MQMYLQKVTSRKNCVEKLVFAGILNVSDENSRIRIQVPDPDPHQNVMDPEHWKNQKVQYKKLGDLSSICRISSAE